MGRKMTIEDIENIQAMLDAKMDSETIARIAQTSVRTVRRVKEGNHALLIPKEAQPAQKRDDMQTLLERLVVSQEQLLEKEAEILSVLKDIREEWR